MKPTDILRTKQKLSVNPNQRGIGGKPPTFVQNDFTP